MLPPICSITSSAFFLFANRAYLQIQATAAVNKEVILVYFDLDLYFAKCIPQGTLSLKSQNRTNKNNYQ